MAIDGVGVDEPFYFSTPGTTNDEGKIEIVSNNVEISNTYNSGNMLLKCNTTGGVPKTLVKLDPDLDNGAVQLCDSRIYIRTIAANSYLDSLYGDLNYRNLISSKTMKFQTRNASAVFKTNLILNPDTETADFLAYRGASATISADSDNFDVKGISVLIADTTNNNITIGGLSNGTARQTIFLYKQSSANILTIEHQEGTGDQKFITPDTTDIVLSGGNFGGMVLVNHTGSGWRILQF